MKKFEGLLASAGMSALGFLILVYFGTFTPQARTSAIETELRMKIETKADKTEMHDLQSDVQNLLALECYQNPRACKALRIKSGR